jgi:CHAD domain-containing protein
MAPDASVEHEVKLAVWPGFRLPDLTEAAPGAVADPVVEQHLEATYHDTADLRLGRSGITLRYRTGEEVDVWTLKLPKPAAAGSIIRSEHNVPGDPRTMPPELVELVAARIRTAPLVVVAKLHTLRRLTRVRSAEGDGLVEVVDGRRVALRFREVEVELGDAGDEAVLEAVVARLRSAGAGEPDPTPKVIRALGPAALAPPDMVAPPLGRDATAVDVLRAGMVASVERLVDHDPIARHGGDPEGVHQARVATRRLRSYLRVFGALLDPEASAPLRDELSWLADALGEVRDLDVLSARLNRQLSELGPDDRANGALLIARLGVERAAARDRLLVALRSPRYFELLEHLVLFAMGPPVLSGAGRPADKALPALARTPWLSFVKAARRVNDQTSDDDLHEVRIRAKRARYASEVASLVVGKPAQRLADAVSEVQEVLGDHHDAGTAAAWLRAAARDGVPEVAFVAGQLAGRQQAEAAQSLGEWSTVWGQVQKGRLSAWLKP